MTILWSRTGSVMVTAGAMNPRCANANFPPAGHEVAATSDAGLRLLRRIVG